MEGAETSRDMDDVNRASAASLPLPAPLSLPVRDKLVDYAQDLMGACARIAMGRDTPDDDALFRRLLRGSSIDGMPDSDNDASDGAGLVTRYARLWHALDRDVDALVAVRRDASAWPPAVYDVALAYVHVSPSESAVAVVYALARDEALSTTRLSEASAPERLVALLGAAARRGAISKRTTSLVVDRTYSLRRLDDLYDPRPVLAKYAHDSMGVTDDDGNDSDRNNGKGNHTNGMLRFSPAPPVLAQYGYRTPIATTASSPLVTFGMPQSAVPSGGATLPTNPSASLSTAPFSMPLLPLSLVPSVRSPLDARADVVAMVPAIAYRRDDALPSSSTAHSGVFSGAGDAAVCNSSQGNAWWSRACYIPGRDPPQ